MLALDGVQDFLAAAAEEFEIDRQLFIYFADKRQAAVKPFAGALDLKPHHFAKRGSVTVLGQIFFRHGIFPQVFKRQIDSALGEVDANVLPEVCELQRGAGVVGKLLPLGIAIAAEIEYEMSDRIRRIAAVGEHVIESFKTGDGLILAKSDQEVGELVLRDIEFSYCPSKGNEDGMARRVGVAGV